MEVAVDDVRDTELRTKLVGDRGQVLALNTGDHQLGVLFVDLVHDANDHVTDLDVEHVVEGLDADGSVHRMDVPEHGGDQFVPVHGSARSSGLVRMVPDLGAGRDEARRHEITSCVTEVARRGLTDPPFQCVPLKTNG